MANITNLLDIYVLHGIRGKIKKNRVKGRIRGCGFLRISKYTDDGLFQGINKIAQAGLEPPAGDRNKKPATSESSFDPSLAQLEWI